MILPVEQSSHLPRIEIHAGASAIPEDLPPAELRRRLAESTELLTTDPQRAAEILTAPLSPLSFLEQ